MTGLRVLVTMTTLPLPFLIYKHYSLDLQFQKAKESIDPYCKLPQLTTSGTQELGLTQHLPGGDGPLLDPLASDGERDRERAATE